MKEIKLGKYKHFKGKEYNVIGVARDCEDITKEYVVYKALYDSEEFKKNQIWIRPIQDFLGTKLIEGKDVKRFDFIKDNKVKVKKLEPNAIIPCYAHPEDAGLDLFSNEEAEILPGERKLIGTGLQIELPAGFVALVWDKSGVAYKNGIKTMAGVIEHTYRGEYKILLYNTSKENYKIEKHQKIAQLLIQPIISAEVEEVNELSETSRGEGCFGSTGI